MSAVNDARRGRPASGGVGLSVRTATSTPPHEKTAIAVGDLPAEEKTSGEALGERMRAEIAASNERIETYERKWREHQARRSAEPPDAAAEPSERAPPN